MPPPSSTFLRRPVPSKWRGGSGCRAVFGMSRELPPFAAPAAFDHGTFAYASQQASRTVCGVSTHTVIAHHPARVRAIFCSAAYGKDFSGRGCEGIDDGGRGVVVMKSLREKERVRKTADQADAALDH